MALTTSTTWTATDHDGDFNYRHASLERESGPANTAELMVGGDKITLDVEQLRELSTAAARIADEIETTK